MIPKKLRLKNFTGIRSGLGRDEITLDLEELAGDAQLIAIVGPNGSGKTTVLDNLQPFRLMASRASSYSPGSFSYYDNIYGAEAVKELEFEHAGHVYKSILIFKMSAKTKKTECYLQLADASGNWHPAKCNGTISDGKAETYDVCLEHILGTPELFFTSAFAAQNRRSLSAYTNGEMKGLLSELLGLERIRELGKNALEVTKLLRGRLDGMRDELVRIGTLEAGRSTIEVESDAAGKELGTTITLRKDTQERIAAATKNLADAKAELGASAGVEEHRKTLQAQINGATQRRNVTLREIDKDISEEGGQAANTAKALRNEAGKLAAAILSQEKQVEKNAALLKQKPQIDAAVARHKELEKEEADCQADITKKQLVFDKFRDHQQKLALLKNELKTVSDRGNVITTICDELKTRATLIDQVPCKGTDLQPRCQLLQQANSAKGAIPAREEEISKARTQYSDLQAQGKVLEETLDLMGDAEGALNAAHKQLRDIQTEARTTGNLAGQGAMLPQAQEAIDTATAQIAEMQEAIQTKNSAAADTEAKSAGRVAQLKQRRDKADSEAAAEIKSHEHELSLLPPPVNTDGVGTAEILLDSMETDLVKIDLQYEQLNVRTATLKERLRGIENDLKNAGTIKAKAGTIETEIAHWTTLSKAFGNDGIIALCIDDSGPALSGLANDLLVSCYGPRFSVSIKTQRETTGGDMKEDFDIRVFDAERDDDKSVRDMSGGERIYINDVLTRAIALYQAQESGQKYECLFSDESDGALDTEKKVQFTKMKREVLRIGNYRSEIFISHAEEVKGLADVMIDMETYRA